METGSVDRGWMEVYGLVRSLEGNFPAVSLENALTHRTMSTDYCKTGKLRLVTGGDPVNE